jgi:hypothetical protein
MWKNKTVSVILPTYNEKGSIKDSINSLFSTGLVDEVLVVDNNAISGTREEVRKTKARMVTEHRQGYGFSCRRGLGEARGDILILFEPDGTFSAGDIIKVLVYSQEFDVVLGSRTSNTLIWTGANMGLFLRLGNIAAAKMVEFMFNTTQLTDVGCTMKLFKRQTITALRNQFTVGGSHFGLELMLLVIKNGFRFIEIPVNYMQRVGRSSVTGYFTKAFALGMAMIFFILGFWLKHLGKIMKPRSIGTYQEVGIKAINKCPVCGSKTSDNPVALYTKDPDGISTLTYSLVRCRDCGLNYMPFVPLKKDIGYFYFEGYHGPAAGKSFLDGIYRAMNAYFMKLKYKKITAATGLKTGGLLDIGSGNGDFINYMGSKGWKATGVDPNLPDEAKKTGNACSSLSGIRGAGKKYDCITMWHTAEHMEAAAMKDLLKFARGHLTKAGVLFVSIPNIQSAQAALGGERWFHLDLPRHQNFHTDGSAGRFLSQNGFKVRSIRYGSLQYELAGWVQTILNMTGAETNYLYKKMKRDQKISSRGFKRFYSAAITYMLAPVLALLFLPVSLILGRTRLGAVKEITATAVSKK